MNLAGLGGEGRAQCLLAAGGLVSEVVDDAAAEQMFRHDSVDGCLGDTAIIGAFRKDQDVGGAAARSEPRTSRSDGVPCSVKPKLAPATPGSAAARSVSCCICLWGAAAKADFATSSTCGCGTELFSVEFDTCNP